MSELICDKCGAQIVEGSRFCPQCADPVTAADQADRQAAQSSESVKLVCPKCETQTVYDVPASGRATLLCAQCSTEFDTHVTQIRSKRSRGAKRDNKRAFTIRVQDFDGNEDLVEFENGSYDDFELRSKDLAAFSSLSGALRIVQNLTVSRYMTVSRPWCFIATWVFGPLSAEVEALRRFRDERLAFSRWGRAFVKSYYRLSPAVVRLLRGHPIARWLLRCVLRPFAVAATRLNQDLDAAERIAQDRLGSSRPLGRLRPRLKKPGSSIDR